MFVSIRYKYECTIVMYSCTWIAPTAMIYIYILQVAPSATMPVILILVYAIKDIAPQLLIRVEEK